MEWLTALSAVGIRPGMLARCRFIAATVIDPRDPSALLAMADELDLSQDQVERLQAAAESARSTARAVLTAQQRDRLRELELPRTSLLEMVQEIVRQCNGQPAPSASRR